MVQGIRGTQINNLQLHMQKGKLKHVTPSRIKGTTITATDLKAQKSKLNPVSKSKTSSDTPTVQPKSSRSVMKKVLMALSIPLSAGISLLSKDVRDVAKNDVICPMAKKISHKFGQMTRHRLFKSLKTGLGMTLGGIMGGAVTGLFMTDMQNWLTVLNSASSQGHMAQYDSTAYISRSNAFG